MNPLALLALPFIIIIAAPLIVWLFPDSEGGYKHYEGMGELPENYKSWDEMTREEREVSAVATRKDELL